MEIQAQASPAAAQLGAGTAASGGGGQKGAGNAGFSNALNGMLVQVIPQANASQPTENASLLATIQLLTAGGNLNPMPDQAPEAAAAALDALTKLLASSNEKQSDSLVNDPLMQSLLSQLQVLLASLLPAASAEKSAVQPDGSKQAALAPGNDGSAPNVSLSSDGTGTALDALLFVPLASAVQQSTLPGTQEPSVSIHPLMNKKDALHMLNQLKEILLSGNETVQKAVAAGQELPSLMNTVQTLLKQYEAASPAAVTETVNLTGALEQNAAPNDSILHKTPISAKRSVKSTVSAEGAAQSNQAGIRNLVQVVPSTLQKLEALSAKAVPAQLLSEPSAESDALFQPLNDNSSSDLLNGNVQAVPLHEFLKQTAAGTYVPKAPVLQMPAEAFSEQTAEFIVKAFSLESNAEGFSEAKISLFPKHLGQVDVKLTMHNGQLVAQFMADSSAGRDLLESQLPQLRATLQTQGIQVERLEVGQSQNFQSGLFQEHRQQQSQQFTGNKQKSNAGKVAAVDEDFTEDPTEETVPASSVHDNEAKSIDVTA